MAKMLYVDHEKCTGCRLCELVCAVSHDGISNPARSRIRVLKWEAEGIYIPMTCQQCQDAPCLNVCPVNTCIGCRSCVSVCPFGAMNYNTTDRRVLKCDVCDGDPQCVRFCDVKAVEFVEAGDVAIMKSRKAAKRVTDAAKNAADLPARI